ncbi:MAG TPA: alpha/beta hydrolase [Conexibacter sp.]|jgi:pimeloyl-ACP methyl ester carboxylesterase
MLTTETATTALGPVEYAVSGDGAPVLVIHGSPGGCDQAELMARFLPQSQFKAILPSRPGYLGTELGERKTIDQQADLLVALLDELGIATASLLTWSGGGPAGYRIAVRHPDRVTGLVALDAVSTAFPRPHDDLTTRFMFGTRAGDFLMRVMIAHAPEQVIQGTIHSESSLSKEEVAQRASEIFEDETKRQFVLDLALTASRHDRSAGYDNDIAQFEAIDTLELERITAPTMIVQGNADSDVPLAQSEHAAAAIPNAQLAILGGGSHLCFYTHPDSADVQARAVEVLRG